MVIIRCVTKAQMKKLSVVAVFSISLVSFAKAGLTKRIGGIIKYLPKRVQFSILIVNGHSPSTHNYKVYTSSGVLIGFIDGQKDAERNESFGRAGDTIKLANVAT